MSSGSNNFHDGFFARIIRDALCTLPDASGERPPLALEQQLQSVVEHTGSIAPVRGQPNIHPKIPAQTADAIAHTSVPQPISLQDSPLPASAARTIATAGVQPSARSDQYAYPAAAPVNDASTMQATDTSVTTFPRTDFLRAMAAPKPVKKTSLAITRRDPRAAKVPAKDHQRTMPGAHEQLGQAPAQTVIATTPAAAHPATVGGNPEPAPPVSKRPALPVAPTPVITESAPLPTGHRVMERKAAQPELRIGAITLRVTDAAPEQAAPKASQSVKSPAFADPITSAESRHFLRTL